jgi:hypothetical protein
MTLSNTHDPTGAGSSDDLRGLEILLVEDSGIVGEAIKDLLELLGADVVGPAATTADAERLLSEHAPDAALVDFHLRGGEVSDRLLSVGSQRDGACFSLSRRRWCSRGSTKGQAERKLSARRSDECFRRYCSTNSITDVDVS